MRRTGVLFILLLLVCGLSAVAEESYQKDVIETSAGDLEITFIGHGTLMMVYDGKVIHIDPFSRLADYAELPKADMILVTHHNFDHLDVEALESVRTEETVILLTETCAKQVEGGVVMKNGDVQTIEKIEIEAVPAYNLVHKRDDGQLFHPKGVGNGYVLTFGDTFFNDTATTENTPEMKALKNIDYAFLPMNLPYTMTPEMVADAASSFKPAVLFPYHYGETDPNLVIELLKDEDDIEVRVRKMK
jgi:L-ascorbate metabolism protein UlaG (beta-lactamase superfamily)